MCLLTCVCEMRSSLPVTSRNTPTLFRIRRCCGFMLSPIMEIIGVRSHFAGYICCNFEGTDTASPSHLESTFASCRTYMQGRLFFAQPKGLRISHQYISSYASIAAIYRHKIHKNFILSVEKHPKVCICAIFVVPLQPISK